MKKTLLALGAIAVLFLQPLAVQARQTAASITQGQGLTVELVTKLLDAGVPPATVVAMIQQTQSDFNLSFSDIEGLPTRAHPTWSSATRRASPSP